MDDLNKSGFLAVLSDDFTLHQALGFGHEADYRPRVVQGSRRGEV